MIIKFCIQYLETIKTNIIAARLFKKAAVAKQTDQPTIVFCMPEHHNWKEMTVILTSIFYFYCNNKYITIENCEHKLLFNLPQTEIHKNTGLEIYNSHIAFAVEALGICCNAPRIVGNFGPWMGCPFSIWCCSVFKVFFYY